MTLPIMTFERSGMIALLLFVMINLQFVLILLHLIDKESRKIQWILLISLEAVILIILILIYYAYARFDTGVIMGNIPVDIPFQYKSQRQELLFWTTLLLCLGRTLYLINHRIGELEQILSLFSIKEAIDTLPQAIVIAEQDGWVIHSNKKAKELNAELIGGEIKNATLFWDAVQNQGDKCELDGKVWEFEQSDLQLKGRTFRQISGIDRTQAEHLIRELEEKTAYQERIGDELREILANVNDTKKEEVLLKTKYHLFTKLSYQVSIIDQILFSDEPTRQKIQKLDDIIQKGLVLREDTFEEKIENITASFAPFGLTIYVEGDLLYSERIHHLLLSALWESAINAVIHTQASKLWMELSEQNDILHIQIRNNGDLPERITEQGGLRSLRKQIEEMQGTMQIKIDEQFTLVIEIPIRQTKPPFIPPEEIANRLDRF